MMNNADEQSDPHKSRIGRFLMVSFFGRDLVLDQTANTYRLHRTRTVYTGFESALITLTKSEPGNVKDFIAVLQDKLDEKLEDNNPPDAPTLDQIMEG